MIIIYSEDPNFKLIEIEHKDQEYVNINSDLTKVFCKLNSRVLEIEEIICKNPKYACYYAFQVLGKRWYNIGKPEIEDMIGKNPEWACWYSDYVLRKRWYNIGKYDVEDMLNKDKFYSYKYIHLPFRRPTIPPMIRKALTSKILELNKEIIDTSELSHIYISIFPEFSELSHLKIKRKINKLLEKLRLPITWSFHYKKDRKSRSKYTYFVDLEALRAIS